VDVGAARVADQQAAEAVQPGDAALHHPALATAARAVGGTATGDLRPGPPLADLSAVTVVVVAAVGEQVVLGARAAPVDRARPRRGAPFLAGTWLESATARGDHPREVDRAGGAQARQQQGVQLLPDAGPLPLVEASPAGDA